MSMMSLFDAMEFSLPAENYLDESFGLSAEILAADIGSEGSILDSDFGHLGSLKYEPEATSGAVDQALLSDLADSLGQEWMENLDLKTLLNSYNVDGQALQSTTSTQEILVAQPVSIPVSTQSFDPEPRKEGMKVSAYEKLKALLTDQGQVDQSTLKYEPVSPAVALRETFVTSEPSSPEALVPDIQFITPSFDSLLEDSGENVLEDLIQLQTVDTSAIVEDISDIGNEVNTSIVELLSPVTDVNLSINSPDNSYLTSGPSSPSDSFTLETVDISKLKEEVEDSYCSDKSSQISDHEFTKLKSKSKRENNRSTPYEIDVPFGENKKDRKKIQNKNAATRYRVKKRQEKETLQEQETNLSNKNKELKEKVESLQREISYMKELMNEIYKAKQKQSN